MCRDAGALGDGSAHTLVLAEAQPAGGGAVPADGVDLRIRQQFGGGQHRLQLELGLRALAERDLQHAEPAEMARDAGASRSISAITGSRTVLDEGVSMPRRVVFCMGSRLPASLCGGQGALVMPPAHPAPDGPAGRWSPRRCGRRLLPQRWLPHSRGCAAPCACRRRAGRTALPADRWRACHSR